MSQPKQPAEPQTVTVTKAENYRNSYANSVQVRMSVWDFYLVFGTMRRDSPDEVQIENFQGIYLSPQQAKALRNLLAHNLAQYEQTFGAAGAGASVWAARRPRPLARDRPFANRIHCATRAPMPLWMLYPVFFAAVYLSHLTLLRLPYFWDEGGYYIPAAWDFFRTGTLIPVTTADQRAPAPACRSCWRAGGASPALSPAGRAPSSAW